MYYSLSEAEQLQVLENGEVNFDLSEKDNKPCKYFVVENKINEMDLLVTFEFCDKANTVKVMGFKIKTEEEVCDF